MPVSSLEIAQMNGSFQQMSESQLRYARMLSEPRDQMGERIMGVGTNVGTAVGMPLGSVAAGMMGIDPISMAFKGYGMGSMISPQMGFMGAAAGGVASMGLGAAVSYGANQMVTGMQQQQQLSRGLRNTFHFRNNFGTTGFSNADMGAIGGTIRQMSEQVGPSGEVASFEELGRLASNMGRMGMTQGVRDAKDFTERFKTMVSTLKDIAKEMTTSLEEAQKMMVGFRGQGIFNRQEAVAAARQIRAGAYSGQLSTSEMSYAASIGSQVSRMIGGRGNAGAFAGMKTMRDIGSALELGYLSEEQIYESTGLSGAEGRQAYATQQLQSAGQFLRSSKGRWAVAAMAGKNGQLDEEDAEDFMRGHVGIERTASKAHENLNGIGRENFLRYEGKLRGEVLRKFGGLAPAMMYQGWLRSKGIDVNDITDRQVVFLQRQTGMSEDEVAQQLRQLRALPELQRHQEMSEENSQFEENYRLRDKHIGIEGVKHKLAQARNEVQNELQRVGSEFYKTGVDTIDAFINKLTGDYVSEYRRDIVEAFSRVKEGGLEGQQAARDVFGVGGKGLVQQYSKEKLLTNDQFKTEFSGQGTILGALGINRPDAEAFEKAGYGVKDPTFGNVQQTLNTARAIQANIRSSNESFTLPEELKQSLHAGFDQVQGQGRERLESTEQMLRSLAGTDPAAKAIAARLDAATSEEEKASIIGGVTRSIGRKGEADNYGAPNLIGLYSPTKFGTVGESFRDYAGGIVRKSAVEGYTQRTGLGSIASKAGEGLVEGGVMAAGGLAGAALGALISPFTGGSSIGIGAVAGAASAGDWWEGRKQSIGQDTLTESAATYLKSDQGMALLNRVNQGDNQALDTINERMASLSQQRSRDGSLGPSEIGEYESLNAMRATAALTRAGGTKATDEQKAQIAKNYGYDSVESLMGAAGGLGHALNRSQQEARAQLADTTGRKYAAETDEMERAGIVTRQKDGSLSLSDKIPTDVSFAARGFLAAQVQAKDLIGQTSTTQDDATRLDLISKAEDKFGEARKALAGMSKEDLQKEQQKIKGVFGLNSYRRAMQDQYEDVDRYERMSKRYGGGAAGGLNALAGVLGSDVTKTGELKDALSRGVGNEDIARRIAHGAGIGDDMLGKDSELMKKMLVAIQDIKSGGKSEGEIAQEIRSVLSDQAIVNLRKTQAEGPEGEWRKSMLTATQKTADLTEKMANAQGITNKSENLAKGNQG